MAAAKNLLFVWNCKSAVEYDWQATKRGLVSPLTPALHSSFNSLECSGVTKGAKEFSRNTLLADDENKLSAAITHLFWIPKGPWFNNCLQILCVREYLTPLRVSSSPQLKFRVLVFCSGGYRAGAEAEHGRGKNTQISDTRETESRSSPLRSDRWLLWCVVYCKLSA